MTLRTSLTTVAAASVLLCALAGCTPAATESGTDTGAGTETDTSTEESAEEPSGFGGVTLPGTGDYTIPDQAPIGGFELPDNQDGLPAGCSWQLYQADGALIAENNGPFVFLTDVTARFVTAGCPDWVQFE